MAKFSPDPVAAGPAIRGFSGGGFRIDEQVYADGVLLTPETAVAWQAPAVDALDLDAVAPLLAREPAAEFLLLGTGAALLRPSPAFVAACHEATGGNPLLLRELLGMLLGEGIEPTAANVGAVTRMGPSAVARSVLFRLSRLEPADIQVAKAVAVLSDGASVAEIALGVPTSNHRP